MVMEYRALENKVINNELVSTLAIFIDSMLIDIIENVPYNDRYKYGKKLQSNFINELVYSL